MRSRAKVGKQVNDIDLISIFHTMQYARERGKGLFAVRRFPNIATIFYIGPGIKPYLGHHGPFARDNFHETLRSASLGRLRMAGSKSANKIMSLPWV